MKITTTLSLSFLLSASYLPAAMAQTINGTPGSPSATITIDGKQLPPPPTKFGGVIKESAKDSKPWWPPRVVPPKGAPNVLLIMTDDQGYGVNGTFGGVIPTPALDRIAAAGLRYTQFNSTALCSPTRAALITGRNHHSAGFGVISELSTGYPGYDSIITPDKATIGSILKDNGYSTSWFGKNHNTPTYQYSVAGPYDQWPSGMGFEYFYGFMGGETDQWTPYLFRDHTQIFPFVGKPDYNLTTDLADEAIKHMRDLNASAPDKPFLLYYVPGGTHSPHQPKPEWIAKFKGKFDMGYEKLRDEIFANQKRLGVIPADAQLTPWPNEIAKWDSLSLLEKKLFERQAEVFAGYAAYTDNEIGRVIQAVEDLGKLDNTLIIYICGDNGTSPEGTLYGAFNQLTAYNGILKAPEALQMLHYENWGSDKTYPHMAVGWAWAFDTPFKWTKQVASHFGGTRQGLAISWPGHIKDVGGIRTQFHHVIDIVPTILEATGIKAPETVDGKTEFTYTGENAGIPLGNAPDVLDKDFTITAEITVPKGGAEGMIVTLGGRFGGYGFFLQKGKPVFVYNLLDLERFRWEGGIGGKIGEDFFGRALPPGKHSLVFDFKYDGPGPGKSGTGVLTVDGKELAKKKLEHTIPLMMTIDETFDVGIDTRTGVDDSYKLPFKFTGTIDKLTFKLGPSQLAEADKKAQEAAYAKAKD